MALGTKWYGTRAHRYEMTRNHLCIHVCIHESVECCYFA